MGNDQEKTGKQWFIENFVSLGLALLLVFIIRSSIVEAFKIPSGSMIPTLFVGDHIFVNKFAYGLKIPFSDWILDSPIYIIKRDPPKRGDIIVFKFPRDESLYYIKRVVGVPGDVVEIRDKELYINNAMVSRRRLATEKAQEILGSLDPNAYHIEGLELFEERISGTENRAPTIMVDKGNFIGDNYGPITVPSGSYFVMGDNRNYSNDSRFWGFVPEDNIKGKAMIIWLSFWIKFAERDIIFRPSRIGTVLY